MVDFSHISSQAITVSAKAQFKFYALKGTPEITVRPVGETNSGYQNAVLRNARKHQSVVASRTISLAVVKEYRDEDRKQYAEHVVVGWSSVVDKDGKAVPFSKAACKELLDALPDDMFDELRRFCQDMANFREVVDTDETSKN